MTENTPLAIYGSSRSSLKISREKKPGSKRREFFEFRNGVLKFFDEKLLAEFERVTGEMSPAARQWFYKIDANRAANVARKHQANMAEVRGKIIQGAQTAQSRAEQTLTVTELTNKTDAAHRNVALQNSINQLRQETQGRQSGTVSAEAGDAPNPGVETIQQAASGVGTPPAKPTVSVKVPGKTQN